jgi:hypothetical protein
VQSEMMLTFHSNAYFLFEEMNLPNDSLPELQRHQIILKQLQNGTSGVEALGDD